MFNIGFLGIGQGGSNICEIASNFNYTTAIINTSQEDLDAISVIKSTNKLLLGTRGGCGKKRRFALNEIKQHSQEIITFVNNVFRNDIENNNLKIIYTVFTGGGGTGSGAGPVLTDLLNKVFNKTGVIFSAIIISPSKDESMGSFINTIEAINEINKLNIPYTVFDNNTALQKFSDNSKKEAYNKINNSIIKEFNAIFKTEFKSSKSDNIDTEDIRTILTTPGFFFIRKTSFDNTTDENIIFANIIKTLMEDWDKSLYVRLPYDLAISYIGFVFHIENLKVADIDKDEIIKILGTPINSYEGFYEPTEKDNSNYAITILSGLSSPIQLIRELSNMVKTCNDNRINRDNVLGDLTWLSEFKNINNEENNKDNNEFSSLLDTITEPNKFEEYGDTNIENNELAAANVNLSDFFNEYE